MSSDLRCGNKPCGEFTAHRFYLDTRPVEVPPGYRKNVVFTVLGTVKCDSNSKVCLEFQRLHIDYTGQQWWYKTTEGLVRCLEDRECKQYYKELAQCLGQKVPKEFFDA